MVFGTVVAMAGSVVIALAGLPNRLARASQNEVGYIEIEPSRNSVFSSQTLTSTGRPA